MDIYLEFGMIWGRFGASFYVNSNGQRNRYVPAVDVIVDCVDDITVEVDELLLS